MKLKTAPRSGEDRGAFFVRTVCDRIDCLPPNETASEQKLKEKLVATNVPKYVAPQPIDLPERQWPGRTIQTSPLWCSVDLRDGNQALPNPLDPAQKLEYFKLLDILP